jgi:hypothetical protein
VTDDTALLSDADQVMAMSCPGDTVAYAPGDDIIIEGGILSPPEEVGVGVGVRVGAGVIVEIAGVFLIKRTRVCEPTFPEVSWAVIFMVRLVSAFMGIAHVYEPDFGWLSAMVLQVIPSLEEY